MNHTTARLLTVLAAATAGLAACGDVTPDTPLASTRSAPSLSTAAIDGNYLVRFTSNRVPAGFAERVAAMGGTVIFAHAGAGVAAVSGLSPEEAGLLGSGGGVNAVVDDNMTVLSPIMHEVEAADVASEAVASPTAPQTAFFFPRQWHLRAIQANNAWAAGRLGSSTVKVGILDTGLGYTHADLAGRVDLANSVSFVPSDDALVPTGVHKIADLHYHGTHVGATVSSNALAAAGVTSRVTLVGVKVCNVNGQCPTSGTLAGLLYAADLGVDVINLSVGGNFVRHQTSGAGGNGPAFIAIINQVYNYVHRQGTTVVVSAGNSGIDLDHDGNGAHAYCSAATVICVSATGPIASASVNGPFVGVDSLAGYSNFGRSAISVAAPGGNQRPVWAACSPFSLVLPICGTGTFIVGLSGTSMAAPHTTGTAALIVEDVGHSPAQVRARLQQSADDLGLEGTDPKYGKGRINTARAVGVI
ncbi:MAG TPA: S8 family serine peptidase [Longimicrobium sp.]